MTCTLVLIVHKLVQIHKSLLDELTDETDPPVLVIFEGEMSKGGRDNIT